MDEITKSIYNSLIKKAKAEGLLEYSNVMKRKVLLKIMANFRISSGNISPVLAQLETNNLIKVRDKQTIEILDSKK